MARSQRNVGRPFGNAREYLGLTYEVVGNLMIMLLPFHHWDMER